MPRKDKSRAHDTVMHVPTARLRLFVVPFVLTGNQARRLRKHKCLCSCVLRKSTVHVSKLSQKFNSSRGEIGIKWRDQNRDTVADRFFGLSRNRKRPNNRAV
ncbi:unnamed protein product [Ixodes persulcatus]